MKLDSSIAAVVTGGASGLGAATARRLAAQGVKVAIFDLNADLGESLARDLGGVFCQVDVTSDTDVDAALQRARSRHGQERILVNCAGIGNATKTASRDKTSGEITTSRWQVSTASSRSTWWPPSAASPSRRPAC